MSSVTLWAADDHILQVEVRGFTEVYRRFYFRDMQAIIIRRTDRARRWTLALGVLALGLALVAFGAGPGWNTFWWSLAGICSGIAVANLAFGPSCVCTLRTPLQTVALQSLRRLRSARGVLETLRPMIELDQGTLARDEVLSRLRDRAGPTAPPEAPSSSAAEPRPSAADPGMPSFAPAGPPPVAYEQRSGAGPPPIAGPARPVRHESGRVHEVLAYILLLSAAVSMLPLLYFNIFLNTALSVVFVVRIVCVVTALARQNHSDLPVAMKRFAWTTFGWECAMMLAGAVTGVAVLVHLIGSGRLDPASTVPASPLDIANFVKDNPAFKVMSLLSSLASLALGIWGLVVHRRLAPARREPWQILPT